MRWLPLICAVILAGCRNPSTTEDIPAILISPSEETRAELQGAVSSALNGVEVTLSGTALTTTSELIIERNSQRNLQGRVATGRMMETPARFRLLLRGDRCVLEHLNMHERYPLATAQCTPEPD